MGCERLACIAATRANPVKAHVGPVGGEAPRVVGDEVMEAEGCRGASQDGVHLVAEPARITKFDGPAVGARGSLEEVSKWSPEVPIRSCPLLALMRLSFPYI